MKKTYILLALMMVVSLSSCGNTQDAIIESEAGTNPELPQDAAVIDAPILSGSVVIEMQNTHQLAGKTLIFDVEAVSITKKGSGSLLEDTIEVGDEIEVHYTGTLENGEKFDSSHDRDETLPFTVGAGGMIVGFDAGVVGMKLGESKVLTLAPEEAYGPATIIQTVDASELQELANQGFKVELGAKLSTPVGEATIIEINK